MKYEAEIIHKILEKRGHEKSSLHYQSECTEKWIEEAKGGYPKLTDYQSEWLNYIVENPIGNFPYVTLTNITEATIENVVPYSYKSAILSGNTLMNLLDRNNIGVEATEYTFDNGVYTITTNRNWGKIIFKPNLAINKKYFLTVGSSVSDAIVYYRLSNGNAVLINDIRNSPFIFTTPSDKIVSLSFEFPTIITNGTVSYPMLFEYQDGMENWDIPYFEGIQSVKMPVLTTSNEDGTKTNILSTPSDLELRGIGVIQDTLNCLTGEVTERIGELVLDGSHNIVIGSDNIESYETMEFFIEDVYKNGMLNHKQISDKLPYDYSNDDYEHFYVSDKRVVVFVKKSKLATQDTNGFKQYLSQNPLTVQYQLSTESIKTIELTITNQDGETLTKLIPIEGTMHLSTSGTPIQPSFSGEIPVEATTQNLASFIEEE